MDKYEIGLNSQFELENIIMIILWNKNAKTFDEIHEILECINKIIKETIEEYVERYHIIRENENTDYMTGYNCGYSQAISDFTD